MQSSSPRSRNRHRLDSCFQLTHHAQERMASRGVRAEAVEAAIVCGRLVYVRGAGIYAIGRKEIERYAHEGIDLADFEGILVVTSSDSVLTVYRNRNFRGLRSRRSYRHRRAE